MAIGLHRRMTVLRNQSNGNDVTGAHSSAMTADNRVVQAAINLTMPRPTRSGQRKLQSVADA